MRLKFIPIILFSFSCFASYSVKEMSLEEKVGQVLMTQFHGEDANEDARLLIQEVKVGGIIYYNWSNGLHSPIQVQTLSAGLQKLAHPIPLLIAVDQEGGGVARLNQGFTRFPGNKALGETLDPSLAKETAFMTGIELQAVGVNMNLAPVVDVNSNPRNPVIGVRSFGESPETVLLFGEQALNGYKEAGVIATLKHFPGHGDTATDSHEDLPIVYKSKEELEQMELLPFAKLAASADAIMTAHIMMPAFDEDSCSTLSEKTLGYLRDTLGFEGVIVSDSLVMEGVLKKCQTVDEAAIRALNAGCDLLILGGRLLSGERTGFELTVSDVKRIHRSIIEAVKDGRLSEERMNQATQRILDLKNRYLASAKEANPFIDLSKTVNIDAHNAVAKKTASIALKTLKNEPVPSFRDKQISVFAPQLLQESLDQTSLLKADSYYFKGLRPTEDEIETAKEAAISAEALLICSYNAWKNPSQIALIQALLDLKKPTVLVVTRDPLDALLFPQVNLIFKTFSPTPLSIQAVCESLK